MLEKRIEQWHNEILQKSILPDKQEELQLEREEGCLLGKEEFLN